MFFRKSNPITCAVCGKAIEAKERRFVEKNRVTKAERHTHVACRKPDWRVASGDCSRITGHGF